MWNSPHDVCSTIMVPDCYSSYSIILCLKRLENDIYIYIYTHISTYERERERDRYIYIYMIEKYAYMYL